MDAYDGGTGGWTEEIDMKRVFEWHRDHNIYLSYTMTNETLEGGPVSAIDEEVKAMCESTKSHPKFAAGVSPIYFAPPPHLDAAVAALKKYSKC